MLNPLPLETLIVTVYKLGGQDLLQINKHLCHDQRGCPSNYQEGNRVQLDPEDLSERRRHGGDRVATVSESSLQPVTTSNCSHREKRIESYQMSTHLRSERHTHIVYITSNLTNEHAPTRKQSVLREAHSPATW